MSALTELVYLSDKGITTSAGIFELRSANKFPSGPGCLRYIEINGRGNPFGICLYLGTVAGYKYLFARYRI